MPIHFADRKNMAEINDADTKFEKIYFADKLYWQKSKALILEFSVADNETSMIPVAALVVSKLNDSVMVADNASGRICPRNV